MEHENIFQSSPETQPHSRYVELHPKIIQPRDKDKIRPHYRLESDLVLQAAHSTKNDNFSGSSLELAGLKRNPALEEAEFKAIMGDRIIRPKEIADENFAEMERATALKWYMVLSELYSGEHFKRISVSDNGRVAIAIPGCHLAFEVGGVLDFFNEQGIAIDIEAVDINEAAAEKKFMNLDQRCGQLGSTVDFRSQTDARQFYPGKKTDLVILRHPGFVFEPDQYQTWKQITKIMAETKPANIIVSTYNHKMDRKDDPMFVDEVLGFPNQEQVCEGEVFAGLLEQDGYKTTNDYRAFVMDERLKYPLSPYMISFGHKDGKLAWTMPCDTDVTIYGSEEYLAGL